ncbi:hypothetical protein ACFE04_002594 [Oxalis oulophora]
MAKGCSYVVVLFCVLVASVMAVDYKVGDSSGWLAPTSTSFYSDWAASKTFNVGDVLEFDFTTGDHDVATVTKASYDSCDTTTTTSVEKTGPANITLTSAGEHYYFCTFTNHCSRGQKLAINVTSTSSTTPSTVPASSPPTTPSSSGNEPSSSPPPPPPDAGSAMSSSPLGVVSVVIMSVVFGLCLY